jgi:hypothetical protein
LAERGGLQSDRAFAMFDSGGAFVNGKREPRVHDLRVSYNAPLTEARFVSPRMAAPFTFAFEDDPAALAGWLAQHFERPIVVRRDCSGGFPDDMQAPGPTVISTATLRTVASWFRGMTTDDARRRLRANIEVGGVPAFWEDGLYTAAGDVVPFRVGDVTLEGTNPCARCIVPSRDPVTGVPLREFAKVVAERRAAGLPPWAERSRFDHFYRLALNTRAARAQVGLTIHTGDALAEVLSVARP